MIVLCMKMERGRRGAPTSRRRGSIGSRWSQWGSKGGDTEEQEGGKASARRAFKNAWGGAVKNIFMYILGKMAINTF
ncbi:hypothetical protein QJS04_geneDACA003402 [Acorus gramineus]|uniref:Uncharacterized protein n=1 Tax=Acorus gramineus TaxID=55184 RepID=A0AAV9BQV2_ACOGR|nr:hypothetical protein QJS04_geneDACA003402 [Acorus gramineus]